MTRERLSVEWWGRRGGGGADKKHKFTYTMVLGTDTASNKLNNKH